jgi:hypothetical protein
MQTHKFNGLVKDYIKVTSSLPYEIPGGTVIMSGYSGETEEERVARIREEKRVHKNASRRARDSMKMKAMTVEARAAFLEERARKQRALRHVKKQREIEEKFMWEPIDTVSPFPSAESVVVISPETPSRVDWTNGPTKRSSK